MIICLLILILQWIQVEQHMNFRQVCHSKFYFNINILLLIDLYDDIARTSAYRSPPIPNYASMHPNSFFSAVTDPSNTLLSTRYGISPSSYHGQEH